MDETTWQITVGRPYDMLRHVRTRLSARKMQLIACACCRIIWDQLRDARLRSIVETVERHADGLVSDSAFHESAQQAVALVTSVFSAPTENAQTRSTPEAAAALAVQSVVGMPVDDALRRTLDWVSACAQRLAPMGERTRVRDQTSRAFCNLFREIVGNPFQERNVIPEWLPQDAVAHPSWMTKVSSTARSIAEAIRDDQGFMRMPILADALEDVGCVDDELLIHMRDPEIAHARGCWALDLVLGSQ